MKTLGLCKIGNESYGTVEGKIYLLDVFDTSYDLYMNNREKFIIKDNALNIKHFDLLHNDIEFMDKFKQKLYISDKNILSFSDFQYKYKYWVKFNSDIISIIIEEKYDLPCIIHISILSNDSIHEKININNYMTDDGIDNIINQVRFIYGITDPGEKMTTIFK